MGWAGVILAGGIGVRMKSALPKPLHPVCGVPMIAHVATALRNAGVDRIVVVASPSIQASQTLRDAVGRDAAVAVQERPRGTGHAVLAARPALRDASRLMVVYADVPLLRAETLRAFRRQHEEAARDATVLTAEGVPAEGLGRIVRDGAGRLVRIVEERDADQETLGIAEVNSGLYCFRAEALWELLPAVAPAPNGEIYLTDVIGLAIAAGRNVAAVKARDPFEVLGVNDRLQLAEAERALRDRIRRRWMRAGVTLTDPQTAYLDASASIAPDTVILPNTHLRGRTAVGARCEIGPNTVLIDAEIGDDSRIVSSYAEEAVVGARVSVGPFSRLRPGTVVADDAYIGNFAEVKNSKVGPRSRIGHFSYVGDSTLGARVNIGAGTVTCNYDGREKHHTTIGDDAFIGSGSMLVAPVKIGNGATTGAGAVATRDVPDRQTVVGAPARPIGRRRRPDAARSEARGP